MAAAVGVVPVESAEAVGVAVASSVAACTVGAAVGACCVGAGLDAGVAAVWTLPTFCEAGL